MLPQQIHIVAMDVNLAAQLVDPGGAELAVSRLFHDLAQIPLKGPDIALDESHDGEAALAAKARIQIDGHHVVLGARHKVAALLASRRLWLPARRIGWLCDGLGHGARRQQALHVLPFGRIVQHLHLGVLFEWLHLPGRAKAGQASAVRVQRAHQLQESIWHWSISNGGRQVGESLTCFSPCSSGVLTMALALAAIYYYF